MDPASAIIGIVSFGFTVFSKVNEIRKDIKGAPDKVQALQDACIGVELLLSRLNTTTARTVPCPPSAVPHFERLCAATQQCLEEVNVVIEKVVAQSVTSSDESRAPRVRFRKWIMKKGEFEETSAKLKELRETLAMMMDFMNSNYLEFIVAQTQSHGSQARQRDTSSTSREQPITNLTATRRNNGPLRCRDECTCRCHALYLHSIFPQSATPYLGQLFISPRILDWMRFNPLGHCNVETCRGTLLQPAKVAYILPQTPFYGSFQTSSIKRVHFSINTYRTIPYSSSIIQAIYGADVRGVRDLFAKQQASIWDVDIKGNSILWHACGKWQNDPTEDHLEIVRFLVEAGADALFLADTETTYSAHDTLAIGLFTHLLGEHDPGRSFTATIHTNSAAIAVFCSIFNMDALDAIQDVLSRCYGHSDEDASRLLTSLEATEYAVARSSVFDAIRYTPLQYAIRFSPSSVESLLAEGADAAAEPTLAYAAVCAASTNLIRLLIDNGADVNMKDAEGRTALHWACYWCHCNTFFELVRCAEDKIDWDARTSEGQNALDLFDEGVSREHTSGLTSAHVDEFRSTIMSRMDPSQLQVVEDEPLNIPGAFPITA